MNADTEQLAALHARCFTLPRPWSADEFAGLLASPHVFLLTKAEGFLLGRSIAGEAELLTLAVAPEARRRGIGAALTADFANTARRHKAEDAFLEVASNNTYAQALYSQLGWQQTGRRRNYYAPEIDALILYLKL